MDTVLTYHDVEGVEVLAVQACGDLITQEGVVAWLDDVQHRVGRRHYVAEAVRNASRNIIVVKVQILDAHGIAEFGWDATGQYVITNNHSLYLLKLSKFGGDCPFKFILHW